MFNLKPKDKLFFDLFSKGAEISSQTAKELKSMMSELNSPEAKLESMKKLEHEGDIITHELMERTRKMFITPLDREDIFNITKGIDNITDDIEAAAYRFYMYSVKEPTPEALEIIDKLVEVTDALVVVISELRTLNKSSLMVDTIIDINTVENAADVIYRQAIKKLFDDPQDILYVTKWKDLYKYLEDSIDACERLANEIRGVVMKYA